MSLRQASRLVNANLIRAPSAAVTGFRGGQEMPIKL